MTKPLDIQQPIIPDANCASAKEVIKALMNKRGREEKRKIHKALPELLQLERKLLNASEKLSVCCHDLINYDNIEFPVYSVQFGEAKKDQPRLLIIGGVHGIERIGARVAIALIHAWAQRLEWEAPLLDSLQRMSITFIPIANPVGMYLNRRANGNSVDLMRNSPIEAEGKVPFLIGGQRISSLLSWYRGKPGKLERENQVIEKVVKNLCKDAPLVIALDCHSGFGFRDRLWFPYAYRRRPMNDIAPVVALKLLWERGYPHHNYIFEPQSNHYMTHGDMWDYLYKTYGRGKNSGDKDSGKATCFLPLTLEMGSWAWVKKKPSQLFSLNGLFNPLVHHREKRVLRTHLTFFDFLRNAALSYENWLPNNIESSKQLTQMANSLWYQDL